MPESDSDDNLSANEQPISRTDALETQFTVSQGEVETNFENLTTTALKTDKSENYVQESDVQEESDGQSGSPQDDDYIDEEHLKDVEMSLTEEDREKRYIEAIGLKKKGNEEFKEQKYLESAFTYTEALRLCPLKYSSDRSIFYANRAASKSIIGRKESAIEDCTKAIDLNDKYVRAYLRRARLYEESDKLDESLADYKKILEIDKGNKDALQAQYRLPPLIAEKNEKLKTEMLGKLKELGNMVLKPFGLSTDNFQMTKDPNSGGYSLNFTQNK